jgi:16S rRNA (guanine966-N2)-methyltransferase
VRIIGGQFRRRSLRAPDTDELRPTARRLRATLFEFLAPHIVGARLLDLCAGTGAVGLEALSRGAAFVTFVEHAPPRCALIETNLSRCGATTRAEVVPGEAAGFLARTAADATWDIAFFDPPYATDYAPVLTHFSTGAPLRRRGGVLVVEHHCEHKLGAQLGVLHRWRLVRQGQSCLSFYERRR